MDKVHNINIRNAVPDDAEAIARIYNQAIDLGYVTADTQHVTPASRAEILYTITHIQKKPFWVAETDHKVVAFFYFRNFYDRPAYSITAEIGLYIDNAATGKGIGTYLLDFCLKKAPALGIENVLALIFAENTPSISLFKKMGFEIKGELNQLAKMENRYQDLILLVNRVTA